MAKIILIVGSTGKQGQALIAALNATQKDGEDAEFHMLALTRNPAGASAAPNVTAVKGDLDKPEEITSIFEEYKKKETSIWGVFCVLAYPGLGGSSEPETRQGKTLIDLAIEYDVKCFIYSSNERAGISIDDTIEESHRGKVNIENNLRQATDKGLPWVIMRPGFFMETFEGMTGSFAAGVMKNGMKKDAKLQLVAVDDIGQVAANVFRNPEPYIHKALRVVGDELTMEEQDAAYRRGAGKAMPSSGYLMSNIVIKVNQHARMTIHHFESIHDARTAGKNPDDAAELALAKQAYPNLTTFEMWAKGRQNASQASKSQKKNWNNLSLVGLLTGRT